MSLFLRINFLALCLCMPLLAQANAQSIFNNNFNVTAMIAAVPVSKQQAAGIALQFAPGRVLKVTFKDGIYRVKIISKSGDVVSVFVDGQTGEILQQ